MPMRARRTREEESNRTRLMLSTGLPMTLGNIRANGIRTLAAWCLGRSSFSRNEAPTAQLYYTGSMTR